MLLPSSCGSLCRCWGFPATRPPRSTSNSQEAFALCTSKQMPPCRVLASISHPDRLVRDYVKTRCLVTLNLPPLSVGIWGPAVRWHHPVEFHPAKWSLTSKVWQQTALLFIGSLQLLCCLPPPPFFGMLLNYFQVNGLLVGKTELFLPLFCSSSFC